VASLNREAPLARAFCAREKLEVVSVRRSSEPQAQGRLANWGVHIPAAQSGWLGMKLLYTGKALPQTQTDPSATRIHLADQEAHEPTYRNHRRWLYSKAAWSGAGQNL
jgi:hypothetical protein